MKIERIRVRYGRTWPTDREFESIRLDCELEASVDEAESRAEARVTLQAMAREAVRDEYRVYQQAQSAKKAGKPPGGLPEGALVQPAVADPEFRRKVQESERLPSIIKPPVQGGTGTAEVKSGTGPVTGDIDKDGY